MAESIMVTLAAGAEGEWTIRGITTLSGESLAPAERLSVRPGRRSEPEPGVVWSFVGATGAPRYTLRKEQDALAAVQPGLGRHEATEGAFIGVRKSDAWWSLGADERRQIFETDSRHIAQSMRFLPAIARRLYHARELGQSFDFLTWFEFSPAHASAFDELLAGLRASDEWRYVEREVDVRLTRTPAV